jgi:hypothetical protein
MGRTSGIILTAIVLAAGSAFTWLGGWAVVSVSKIPDAWITGKPLELTWRVRQHGVTPLDKDIAPLIAFINSEHGRVSATR